MILNFIYNSLESDIDPFDILPPDNDIENLNINYYDISYTKDKKKGRAILNKYAARELPVFELTDDDGNYLYFSYAESRLYKLTKEYILSMLAEDLKIGDIILVEGGSSNYNIEILDISSSNIKYRYTDLPKTNNWADFSTFNKTFKILEILKEGDGKRKGNKTITVSKKSKKK